ncbi:MAG: IclR family transcriptional regulator [Sedimentisphaeraceae bacterium JB056]
MGLIQSVDKSLSIIEEISKEPMGLGVRELARRVDIGLTSAHNIASTLSSRGYLWQDDNKKYRLGVKLLKLSKGFQIDNVMAESAKPVVEALVSEVGETAVLAAVEQGVISKILHITANRQLRVEESGDDMGYAHATGYGKILLASMSNDILASFLKQHDLKQFTDKTICGEDDILQELITVRKQGYAVTSDEAVEGVSAVAVSVKDSSGQIIAALGISMPTVRFSQEIKTDILDQLRKAAKQLTEQWG